jgi:hypothetical protein
LLALLLGFIELDGRQLVERAGLDVSQWFGGRRVAHVYDPGPCVPHRDIGRLILDPDVVRVSEEDVDIRPFPVEIRNRELAGFRRVVGRDIDDGDRRALGQVGRLVGQEGVMDRSAGFMDRDLLRLGGIRNVV